MGGKKFSVEPKNDFIYLRTWGELSTNDVHEPVDAAIELSKQKEIFKLLDNITAVDSSRVSIPVQAKGLGVLWKLQHFKKVAIVMNSGEFAWLLSSSLQAMHIEMSSKIHSFTDEKAAIAWLES